MRVKGEGKMNSKVNRQVVVDNLGRIQGYLPKGYRGPKGNFEAGPVDKEGIRHVSGIYHIERNCVIDLETVSPYPVLNIS
jgi:hypothetical protein